MAWDPAAKVLARVEGGATGANREDLVDQITMVSPWETPFISRIGTSASTSIVHGWTVDRLRAPAKGNTTTSGADAGAASQLSPRRATNDCQLYSGTVAVSTSQQASDKAGRQDDVNYQVWKEMLALLTDCETDYLGVQAKQADAGAGALLAGLGSYVWNGTIAGTIDGGALAAEVDYSTTPGWADGTQERTAGTARALTEAIFNGVVEAVWTAGGHPNSVYTDMSIKSGIGMHFTGSATKYQNLDDAQMTANVDIYDSPGGRLEIVPTRHATGLAYIVEDALVARADFIPLNSRPLAVIGHSDRELCEMQTTIEVKNGEGLGAIYDITAPVGA